MWLIHHMLYVIFVPVFVCNITSFRFHRFFLLDLTLQAAIKKMEEELVNVTKALHALTLRVEESDRYVAVPFSLFSPLHPDLSTVPPGCGEP